MMGPALPDAILWDLDGTLVDTEPQWMAAESRLVERFGGSWSVEDGLALVGRDLLTSGRYLRDRIGRALTPEAIVEELLDDMVVAVASGVDFRPGAQQLLDDVRARGVPCGLVTMSWRRLVEPILAQLPAASFEAVITGDEVIRGKPHPEAYLAAASQLGVRPEQSIAIEDSVAGATSAQAAGCRVVVVPNRVSVPPDPGWVIVSTLVGVDLSGLVAAATGTAGRCTANIRGR